MVGYNTSPDDCSSIQIIWGMTLKLNAPSLRVNRFFRYFIHSWTFSFIHSSHWFLPLKYVEHLLHAQPPPGGEHPEESPWVAHPRLAAEHWADGGAQRGERSTENGKEICQIQLCYFTVWPQAVTGGAHRCPASATAGEACKGCLEKGKLTSEMQHSLESTISLIENQFPQHLKNVIPWML